MLDYFDGEITGGWILTGMGVSNFVAGGILFANGGDRARGASYVKFGFGTAHLAAGVYVNIASRLRKRGYRIAIDRAPDAWRVLEERRMRGVSTQFLILKIVWVTAIAGGGVMAYAGNSSDRPRLEGAGYAVATEAALTLVFDIFASRRAKRYRSAIADGDGEPQEPRPTLTLVRDIANEPVLVVGRVFAF